MINPDLIYMMHEQRHQKLWAEAEQMRAQRELASGRATRSRGWLVTRRLMSNRCAAHGIMCA